MGENLRRKFSVDFFYLVEMKTIFLNTLGIRKGVVDIALVNRTDENTSLLGDKMGKHVKKVTSPDVLKNVRKQWFPVMSSHYAREKTARKYLPIINDLNITIMYDLYKKHCTEHNLEMASNCIYRKVFSEEYNLCFHRPRKDQCRICMAYNTSTDKASMEAEYQGHIVKKKKQISRRKKIV